MTATHDGAAIRRAVPRWQSRVEPILVVSTVGTLAAGGIAWVVVACGCRRFLDRGTLVAVVPALVWMLVALRRGRAGVDLIAVLSLVGTLLVGEYLAGALIAVMLAGDGRSKRRRSAGPPMTCARCSNVRRDRRVDASAPRSASYRSPRCRSTTSSSSAPAKSFPLMVASPTRLPYWTNQLLTGEPLQVDRKPENRSAAAS